MKNEEIIRHTRYLANKHKDDTVLTFETNFHMAFTDIANHIEEQAEENTKLKAEIEQFKILAEEQSKLTIEQFKQIDEQYQEIEQLKLYATNIINARNLSEETATSIRAKMQRELMMQKEIEHLKSELERSVIKCAHGYDKRQNEIGETLIYCEHTDNWMNVTLGECVGNCEAEESLKGGIE